jgi:hypothetical protein
LAAVRILLVVVLALVAAPSASGVVCASAQSARPGFDVEDVEGQTVGVFGLVVPDAGPTTSEARARASLLRGEVRNSLHGDPPSGPARLRRCRGFRQAIVGIPAGGEQPNDRRYVVHYPLDHPGGLFASESTRIPGLISIADVAHDDRITISRRDDPVGYLRDLDERIRDNGRARLPGGIIATLIIAALAFLLPRAAVLAFATLAATNLLLGAAGISEPWLVVALLAAGTLAAVPLALVLRSSLAVGLALAAVVAAYFVALGVEGIWISLSPLGPSQNGRFYGLSNLLETILLVPALAAAALLARRWGWPAFAAVALLALVTVAGSRFGADGGGAIVLAAGYAVLAVLLLGGGRRAVVASAAIAAAAVALVAVDALAGPATHVGETVRGGPGELAADLGNRVVLSWRRATDSAVVAAVVVASILALAVLVARGPRRPLPLAVAAAIAVSLVVNDSPREVALGGLVAYLAVLRGGHTTPPEYTHGAIVRGAEE